MLSGCPGHRTALRQGCQRSIPCHVHFAAAGSKRPPGLEISQTVGLVAYLHTVALPFSRFGWALPPICATCSLPYGESAGIGSNWVEGGR